MTTEILGTANLNRLFRRIFGLPMGAPKFVLILYYLLPFADFGQTVVTPYHSLVGSAPFGLVYTLENNVFVSGSLHFSTAWNYVYDSYQYNYGFPMSGGQPVYSEPISLKGMIRRDDNKMGASATGRLVYTGGNDAFAYADYGRTGKLIWRTDPIANNMMATRWSLANFNIFRRASLPSISDQMK